ncbi:hypothetical protein [Pedobacter punctiformis]|uniref:Rad50/SbcC-type AAA domain-containing protein n=1 Tax=Pedobacter punctiformis TaxID=3004097 RepID=A0ABT4L7R9_9SPHI|nr:hypothetical protein [Pedobacter sp. HCMS5-2]MCZ4243975.1 hypothetical protein [Pedobacter sp. HCMS5-2]
MNTAHLINIAKEVIPDLALVKDNIYKGTLNIEDKVAGIYYIDFSNKSRDDFEDFQEDLLSDEFYSNPGNLQWNYYLFLLNDKLNADEKSTIEKNDKYARKFVLDEKGFEDFFQYEEADKVSQTNIVADWKTALEEVDLQEVYTEASYVEILNRFSSNSTKKDEPSKIRKGNSDASKINFVNKVLLKDNYRKQPSKVREFAFGKVNLVKGINGVGKTSVFEAIELMLCGRSMRNSAFKNPDGCIEAQFNDDKHIQKFQHSNNQLFQSRDLSWYGSTYPQGNYLFNSFNRFNYFNADAGQDFASSTTDGQIRDALFNIVLGPEFGYIEERTQKMLERIRPEYNKIKDLMDKAEKEVDRTSAVIASYKEPEHLKFITQKVAENITVLNFVEQNLEITINGTKVEDLNNQLSVIFKNFSDSDFIYNSIIDFQRAESDFFPKKKAYNDLIAQVKNCNQLASVQTALQKQLEQDIDVIKKSLIYLGDEQLLKLNGIESDIKEQEFNLRKIDFVRQQLKEISISEYKMEMTVSELERIYREETGKYRKEISEIEMQLKNELEKLGKIDQLVSEIKLQGREFIRLDPNALNCPMCQTLFKRSDLETQIREIIFGSPKEDTGKKPFDSEKLEELRSKTKNIEQKILEINKIKDTHLGYYGSVTSTETLKILSDQLETVLASWEERNGKVKQMKELVEFAELAGVSEKELKELKFKIENSFDRKFTFTTANKDKLESEMKSLENKLGESKLQLQNILKDRLSKGMEVKRLLDIPSENSLSITETDKIIDQKSNEIEIFRDIFSKLQTVINLALNDQVSEYKRKSDLLNENIRTYKEAVQGQLILNQTKEALELNNKLLKDNRPKLTRFEKAYFKLKELTSGQASDHVDKFFSQNFAEIIDIFKAIHIPKEFVDIKFIDGKQLLLVDEDGKERSVTEISTGQRSALALSIFLSLNKKLQNGPEIIMFDDPVAFIDDLNALSFLDYLRMYVLPSGKQIFFATANMRLAHLFEKKFSFLENDFKHWHLVR